MASVILITSLCAVSLTAYAKSPGYTFKTLEQNEEYFGGTISNYSKYPVFKGKSKAIKKINKSLKKHAREHIAKAYEYDDHEGSISWYYDTYGQGKKVEFLNVEKSKVTFNKKKIVSVRFTDEWFFGGAASKDVCGLTYNIKTGKKLKIKAVIPKKYNPASDKGYKKLRSYISKKLDKKYGSEVAEAFLAKYGTKADLGNINFYVSSKGKVIVCFPTGDIAEDSAGCLKITVPSNYSK